MKLRYVKKFNSIISDLNILKAKGMISQYDISMINLYLMEINYLMSKYGKKNAFRVMYLALKECKYIRSKYEVLAYKLVANKFHKWKIVEICEKRFLIRQPFKS